MIKGEAIIRSLNNVIAIQDYNNSKKNKGSPDQSDTKKSPAVCGNNGAFFVIGAVSTEADEQHCGRQAVLDRLIEVVLIQVLRDLMDQRRLHVGLLAGLADPRLAKAINAMHAEPARNWSLEDLAATAGMSRARFAARFRDIVGMTPGSYLGEWRLGVAQSLLRQGKPVQLVSDLVGYGSASALSRAFRAQIGVSPTQWLKQYRAEHSSLTSLPTRQPKAAGFRRAALNKPARRPRT